MSAVLLCGPLQLLILLLHFGELFFCFQLLLAREFDLLFEANLNVDGFLQDAFIFLDGLLRLQQLNRNLFDLLRQFLILSL